MKYFFLILLSSIIFSCTYVEQPKVINPTSYIDSIYAECKGVRITFFKDFTTSKTSIIAKELKSKKSIDSLFSFIGAKSTDSCELSIIQYPVGEIYFFSDTIMKNNIENFYFTLNGTCQKLYNGFQNESPKYDILITGVEFLKRLQNEMQ